MVALALALLTPLSFAAAPGPSEQFLRRTISANPHTAMQRSAATEIAFQAGTAELTPESQAKLDALILDAHKRGQIDQVKVLSWGDISYPASAAVTVPKSQKDLAKSRNEAIEGYIEKKNSALYVESYNMAERPTALQDLLNTSEAQVKDSLERAGITGDKNRRGSRAMVMVIVR
jgi:hypothetical protein